MTLLIGAGALAVLGMLSRGGAAGRLIAFALLMVTAAIVRDNYMATATTLITQMGTEAQTFLDQLRAVS